MANNNIFTGDFEVGPKRYWHRGINLAGAAAIAQNNVFFNTDEGTAGKHVINLQTASRLNPPTSFSLQKIGFFFNPLALDSDIQTFYDNFVWELTLDDRVFRDGLLWMAPGGGGMWGNTVRTGDSIMSNGVPDVNAMWAWPEFSLLIPPSVFIGVKVRTDSTAALTVTNALRMWCVLDGIRTRGTQ